MKSNHGIFGTRFLEEPKSLVSSSWVPCLINVCHLPSASHLLLHLALTSTRSLCRPSTRHATPTWLLGLENWLVSYASSLKPIHGTYLNIIFDDKIPIFESSFSIILHECWCRRKKVKQFLSMSQPVLFIGESGTAKSVACLHRHFCGFVQKWRPLKSNSLLFLCYPY